MLGEVAQFANLATAANNPRNLADFSHCPS